MKQFRRVLELDSDHAEAMVLLALKLQELSQEGEASTLVERALQKSPGHPYVLRYAAMFYRKEGDVENAFKLLEKALKITPNSSFLYHQIGQCYNDKLQALGPVRCSNGPDDPASQEKATLIEQCRHYFSEAVALKPSFTGAKVKLADILIVNEEIHEAEMIYSDLLKLEYGCPEDKQYVTYKAGKFELYWKRSEPNAVTHFLEGFSIKRNSKQQKLCRTSLEKIAKRRLRNNPGDIKALCILGAMYLLDGEEPGLMTCFVKLKLQELFNEE